MLSSTSEAKCGIFSYRSTHL